MDQYRIYLRAELGKLRSIGDAVEFLAKGRCELERIRLTNDPGGLVRIFSSQDRVDSYVHSLDRDELVELTECCGRWRNNGIVRELRLDQDVELMTVSVEKIRLNQAEPHLRSIFEHHRWLLTDIARDPELLSAPEYASHKPGELVAVRACLAKPEPGLAGIYRIFDGIHRAIQMARNGESEMPLWVVSDRVG